MRVRDLFDDVTKTSEGQCVPVPLSEARALVVASHQLGDVDRAGQAEALARKLIAGGHAIWVIRIFLGAAARKGRTR